jgi:hypothetical protein
VPLLTRSVAGNLHGFTRKLTPSFLARRSRTSLRFSPVRNVPSPRLVGIEPNPGPRKGKSTAVTVVRQSRPLLLPKAKASSTTTVVTRRRSGPRRGRRARQGPARAPIMSDYIRTMTDPFECGPVKLGYDCFVNTVLATAYLRTSFTVNADGSFSVVLFPDATYFVGTNNAALASAPAFNLLPAANNAGINNQGTEGRVVSAGIRVIVLFPRTAASGVLFGGNIPNGTRASVVSLTTANFTGLADAELGLGSSGIRVLSLPQDNYSFEFNPNTLSGYSTSSLNRSIPFVAGQGFPAGSVVWVEAVMNLEILPAEGSGTVGINADDVPTDTLSQWVPSPEAAFRLVRPLMKPVILDFAQGLLSASGPMGAAAASAIQFGRNRAAYVAGASSYRQSIQASSYGEEQKYWN